MKNVLLFAFLIGTLSISFTSCMSQTTDKVAITKVTPAEFKAKMTQEKNAQLVDVRTPQEFAAGHIDGALNINFLGEDFATQIQKLDKNRPVLLYCKSGVRSSKAASAMEQMGFKEMYNLDGGYLAWAAQQ